MKGQSEVDVFVEKIVEEHDIVPHIPLISYKSPERDEDPDACFEITRETVEDAGPSSEVVIAKDT